MKTLIFFLILSAGIFAQDWRQTQIDSGSAVSRTIILRPNEVIVGMSLATGFEADTVTFQVYNQKLKRFEELAFGSTPLVYAVDTLRTIIFDPRYFNEVSALKVRANTKASPDAAAANRIIYYIVGKQK